MRFRFSLAYPIIGLMVLAVFGTAMPLHYLQINVLEKSLRSAEWARAEGHHNVIKTYISEKEQLISTIVRVLKNRTVLRHAAADFFRSGGFERGGDARPLKRVLNNFNLLDSADYKLVIADPLGRVILGTKDMQQGDIVSGWGVAEALTGKDILVTTTQNGVWEIRAVAPLLYNDASIGVIIASISLNDQLACRISENFCCNVSFGNLSGIVASVLPSGNRSAIDKRLMMQAISENKAKRKDYPEFNKTVYYGPLRIVDELFCLIVEIDTSEADAVLAEKQKEALIFSIITFLIASGLAGVFILKVIRPLQNLRARAENVAAEMTNKKLEFPPGNEVQNLVFVFDRMVAAINHHIAKREDVEGQLRNHRDQLEVQVAERTERLRHLNVKLHREIEMHKEAEKALMQNKAELEKLLKELKETQAQMIHSEKMASVGQLAAGVAHEINNPTGFLSSNLNVLSEYQEDIFKLFREYRKIILKLKEMPPDIQDNDILLDHMQNLSYLEEEIDIDFLLEDVPHLISESKEGAERIRTIVLALKDFAHPGNDNVQSSNINTNLSSTLNVVWNELKYKAKVTTDFGELAPVVCYPQQLNQVFMNILVNAAQAIEKEGEIKIKTRTEDQYALVVISDTGRGIPEHILSRIFDPFYTTKEVGQGTGLGLHISYNIIQKHGGTIQVESSVGKGTTFLIRVPFNSCINSNL